MAGALVLGLSARLALADETTKRFWVDKAAGVSIAFPTGDLLKGFKPHSAPLIGNQVFALNRPVIMNDDPIFPVMVGSTTCVMRLRYDGEGALLQRLLAESRAAPDGGKADGKARCERTIYGKGVSPTFYGVALDEGALGLRETCTAAYRLPATENYPYVVSQMTTFTAGRHGYELQCMMLVKSEASAKSYWQEQAKAFLAIRDSIAVAPATP